MTITQRLASSSSRWPRYPRCFLELLHEVLAYRPHTRSLPIQVHGNGKDEQYKLDNADPDKHHLGAFGLDPFGDEETKNQSVEHVLAKVEGYQRLASVLTV